MENDELFGEIRHYENEVQKPVGGQLGLPATLTTEEERVQALEKYCGVRLSEPEVIGIHGMSMQLRE